MELKNIILESKKQNLKKEIAKEAVSLTESSLLTTHNDFLKENFDLEDKDTGELVDIYEELLHLKSNSYATMESMVLENEEDFLYNIINEMLDSNLLLELRWGRGFKGIKDYVKGALETDPPEPVAPEPVAPDPVAPEQTPISHRPKITKGPERGLIDDKMFDTSIKKLRKFKDNLELQHQSKLGELQDLTKEYIASPKDPEKLREIRARFEDKKKELQKFREYKKDYENKIDTKLQQVEKDRDLLGRHDKVMSGQNRRAIGGESPMDLDRQGIAHKIISAMKKEDGLGKYIRFDRKPIRDTVVYVADFLSRNPEYLNDLKKKAPPKSMAK